MATVVADMSMSLDGFVADPRDGVTEVFAWYGKGQEVLTAPGDGREYRVDPASAQDLQEALDAVGALVCGRRLFDMTDGWGGTHPVGRPVFVITHRPAEDWVAAHPGAPFTFVHDGVTSAIAQAKEAAGEKVVAVASPTVAQQCLNLGLLDGVRVSLVPVLLGSGIRLFDHLEGTPIVFEDEVRVTAGVGVTHLHYRVAR